MLQTFIVATIWPQYVANQPEGVTGTQILSAAVAYQCHIEPACSRLCDCMFVYHWVLRFSQGTEWVAWRLNASMELTDRKVHPAALSKASAD